MIQFTLFVPVSMVLDIVLGVFIMVNNVDKKNYYNCAYFFGKHSNYIFGYNNLRCRFLWRKRLAIVKRMKQCAQPKLLDIGCAFGFFLKFIENDFDVYGVDISEYAAELARVILSSGNNRIKVTDIETGVPFDERFDIITAFDVVEHFDDPIKAFRNFYEALKPGGFFYMELPFKQTLIHNDISHCYRPVQEWIDLLTQTGFRLSSVQTYYTIGLRMIMIPSRRFANYCSVVVQKEK